MLVIFGAAGENGPVDPACRRFVDGTPYVSSCLALGASTVAFTGASGRTPSRPRPGRLPAPMGSMLAADANGIQLPAGFTSRVIARSGQTVPGTSYTWHSAPDGGACFADGSGWIYVSNSEVNRSAAARRRSGSAPAARSSPRTGSCPAPGRTAPAARRRGTPGCPARRSTAATSTRPTRGAAPRRGRPAMGRFKHEAAAATPSARSIYLTEDETNGRFYRFVPTTWGDLSSGTLQVARRAARRPAARSPGRTSPIPTARPTVTRNQVSGSSPSTAARAATTPTTRCWFTTKGDNRVWQLNPAAGTSSSPTTTPRQPGTAPLTGVDNITGSPSATSTSPRTAATWRSA